MQIVFMRDLGGHWCWLGGVELCNMQLNEQFHVLNIYMTGVLDGCYSNYWLVNF